MDKQPFFATLIGDSLSLPRYKSSINIEDTHFYHIGKWWQERYGQTVLWPLSRGGATIKTLISSFYSLIPYIGSGKIDVAIVHLGVVDCAPRPLPYTIRTLLGMMNPFIRNRLIGFLHKNRRKLYKMGLSFRFTSPYKFRNIYTDLLKDLSSECLRVYVINIAPGTDATYRHSPGLKESIILYNDIINQVESTVRGIRVIDIYSELQCNAEQGETEDIHISKEGHDFILKKLCEYEEMIWRERRIDAVS